MDMRVFIKIFFLLIMISSIGISGILVANSQVYATQAIWRDYKNMKDLIKAIKNGDKDDDNMDWDKFKNSAVYKNEDKNVRDCIDFANKVGEKLGDYEVVRCFKNANYFSEKYSSDKGNQNQSDVKQQQDDKQNQNQNQSDVKQQQDDKQNQNQNDVSQTNPESQGDNSGNNCDSSYPDVCITTNSAKLTCLDIPYRNFKVLAPDPHKFDSDGDSIGCES
jgi:cobalamin biosynthesis protein CobT